MAFNVRRIAVVPVAAAIVMIAAPSAAAAPTACAVPGHPASAAAHLLHLPGTDLRQGSCLALGQPVTGTSSGPAGQRD
jgi:hypothetical protein